MIHKRNEEDRIKQEKIKVICDYNKDNLKFQRHRNEIVSLLYNEGDRYLNRIYMNVRHNKINDILDE